MAAAARPVVDTARSATLSSAFFDRDYNDFVSNAKEIGKITQYQDPKKQPKLSWDKKIVPYIDCHWDYIPVQAIKRAAWATLGGCTCDGFGASQIAVEWTYQILTRFPLKRVDIAIFELAQRAFLQLSELYAKESISSKYPEIDKMSSNNYKIAAAMLSYPINVDTITEYIKCLSSCIIYAFAPVTFQPIEEYKSQIWYKLFQECNRIISLKKEPNERERYLADIFLRLKIAP